MTQQEVADVLGVSRAAVADLEKNALRKLRIALKKRGLHYERLFWERVMLMKKLRDLEQHIHNVWSIKATSPHVALAVLWIIPEPMTEDEMANQLNGYRAYTLDYVLRKAI